MEAIVEHKHDLLAEFVAMDKQKAGTLPSAVSGSRGLGFRV